MLKLRKASIVILAQAHNPSIVSPDWVQKALLIKEKPSNFIHTLPFSLFDSTSFLLTLDTERLELVSKNLDDDHLDMARKAVSSYFLKLPHIPYRSLGLNYIWEYTADDSLPKLELLINRKLPSRIFRRQGIEYGGYFRMKEKPYILTVRMDYEGDKTVIFNYNFTYIIENANKAGRLTASFLKLKGRSQYLTESILAGGSNSVGK